MEHEIEPVNGADELPLKKHPELSPDMRSIERGKTQSHTGEDKNGSRQF